MKYRVTTDPAEMIELMERYPRLYSRENPWVSTVDGQCLAEVPVRDGSTIVRRRRCRRPAGHIESIHVHAYKGRDGQGVQDPTTDHPRWKITHVYTWFSDATETQDG